MADRVAAHILIGGTLFRNRFPELVQVIGDDNPAIDWDGTSFDPASIPLTSPLSLMDDDVANGRFEAIEHCCRRLGLLYVRWSGGHVGSFPSVRVIYPGYGEPETFLTAEDDTLIFSMERIRELGSVEAIEAEYRRAHCDPPPLTIIDDDPADDDERETPHG